jgi:hypothetical protein
MWFNPIMIWLLKSPFLGMISKGTMLVSVKGRKSGKLISTPTNYLRDGNTLWVISWRDRKWWRNLRGDALVGLRLAGKDDAGCGHVIEDDKEVAQSLVAYYKNVPQHAKYVGVGLGSNNQPLFSDCERAAQKMVMVRIEL